MINAIVIDDEPKAADVIKYHVSKISFLNIISVFYDPNEAITFVQQNPIDLIFLDINMPELSGIELLKKLKILPKVIFTTAYSQFALESYDFGAIDYLLKPIEFERFQIAVNKAKDLIDLQSKDDLFFFIKDGFKTIKIQFDDIYFIKSSGNYLDITTSKKIHTCRMTFNDIIAKLPTSDYARIHNSYLVNIRNIDKIENNHVFIKEYKLPVSSKFKNILFDKLNLS